MNIANDLSGTTLTGGQLDVEALPSTYLAAHIVRGDEDMFDGVTDKDVRKSIRVGEVPIPELAPDEVLIAIMASAVNYNTVWSAMFEPIPTFRFLERLGREGGWHARHDLPYHVIGSDGAGIVVRVGVGVRRWSVGDRVVVSPAWIDDQDPISQVDGMLCEAQRAWGFETNFGGLAQFAVAKASQLLPKPAHLTWEEAACNTLCAVTAYRMLVSTNGAGLKQGDIVLIWGATGGLGSYAVQFVRNGGGTAIGIVGSEHKAQVLEQLGCDLVLRRDQMGLDGLSGVDLGKRVGAEIRRCLGEDPHIVFDYVGRHTFDASVYMVRRGGVVVTCGSSTGYRHEYDNRRLWMSLKRIVGSHIANWQEAWEANRLIAQGKIVPALSKVYPLVEVGEAAREVQLNRHVGKIGVLCLAEREGLGVEDPELRAMIGDRRLGLFRERP
ncbi:MAG TPA: crotonyl-CoA carboxylase/reductase [Solirubrobacteraceae bacterium]|jgi:crotonyl-CoA reductase|nr:crotonyl-CoA carboxylase/reductase [Solirubrobacteraceae bacterium]